MVGGISGEGSAASIGDKPANTDEGVVDDTPSHIDSDAIGEGTPKLNGGIGDGKADDVVIGVNADGEAAGMSVWSNNAVSSLYTGIPKSEFVRIRLHAKDS
jgi:hypothetical protein